MLCSTLLSPGHFGASPSLPCGVGRPPLHSYSSSWRRCHSMTTPRQHWPVHCQPQHAQPSLWLRARHTKGLRRHLLSGCLSRGASPEQAPLPPSCQLLCRDLNSTLALLAIFRRKQGETPTWWWSWAWSSASPAPFGETKGQRASLRTPREGRAGRGSASPTP